MSCPTLEDVTREFLRRLQIVLGGNWRARWQSPTPYRVPDVVETDSGIFIAVADSTGVDPTTDDGTHWLAGSRPGVDVYGGGGETAVEVVDETGAPVIEIQDRPKVSVIGPTLRDSPLWGGFVKGRVYVDQDNDALTFQDAPLPVLQYLDFQIVATSMRESTSASGQRGVLWLTQQLAMFGAGDYLLGDGWTADEQAGYFHGYWYEMTGDPKRIPGASSSLQSVSCTITIQNVRLTDGSNDGGPLAGEMDFTTSSDPTLPG